MAETTDNGGFIEWVKEHSAITIGFGVVAVLLIAAQFMKKNSANSSASGSTSPSQDLSGLATDQNGNHIVYVPTQTTFSTTNTVGNNSVVNSPTSTTTATTTVNTSAPTQVVNGGPVTVTPPPSHPVTGTNPPTHTPPVQPPVTHHGGLVWDQSYSIHGGDTLSGIASTVTAKLRASGMPSTVSVGYNDIYAHNQAKIDATASAHHNPIPGGPKNNIFPGELLILPRWDSSLN